MYYINIWNRILFTNVKRKKKCHGTLINGTNRFENRKDFKNLIVDLFNFIKKWSQKYRFLKIFKSISENRKRKLLLSSCFKTLFSIIAPRQNRYVKLTNHKARNSPTVLYTRVKVVNMLPGQIHCANNDADYTKLQKLLLFTFHIVTAFYILYF